MTTSEDIKPTEADSDGTPTTVVVGLDGSDESLHALSWAEAVIPDPKKIVPVVAYDLPNPFMEPALGALPVNPAVFEEAARAQLNTTLADRPELLEAARVEMGHAGSILCRLAAGADLLIVGTRGRGGLASTLLGSTSSFCVKRSTVPVAIVPADTDINGPITSAVVGVDGSANADAALRWAVDNTAAGGTVHAVTAISNSSYSDSGYGPTAAAVEHQLREVVRDAVNRLGGDEASRSVSIESHTRQTDARIALDQITSETGADLIVIGARGTGGLKYLILGSVASALVHHPTTTTVVVPAATSDHGDA